MKHRSGLSKFRLSNHRLTIETGRHGREKLEKEECLCPLCEIPAVEDEIHFLVRCQTYNEIRSNLFDEEMSQIIESPMDDKEKFVKLMRQSTQIAKFIHHAMELRMELIEIYYIFPCKFFFTVVLYLLYF